MSKDNRVKIDAIKTQIKDLAAEQIKARNDFIAAKKSLFDSYHAKLKDFQSKRKGLYAAIDTNRIPRAKAETAKLSAPAVKDTVQSVNEVLEPEVMPDDNQLAEALVKLAVM